MLPALDLRLGAFSQLVDAGVDPTFQGGVFTRLGGGGSLALYHLADVVVVVLLDLVFAVAGHRVRGVA